MKSRGFKIGSIAFDLEGMEAVLAKMAVAETEILERAGEGLYAAGLLLQRESQKKAPVEIGNLKQSAYTSPPETRSEGIIVDVGYTSNYSLYVHEKVGMVLKGKPRKPSPPHRGFYWDPQGEAQAKFLEEPARTHMEEMHALVAAHIVL